MKIITPLSLLRKRAHEKKLKEKIEEKEQQQSVDPTLRHDVERKKSRYDTYGK